MILQKSTEVRDIKENGSRFWVAEVEDGPFGLDTVGIVDENEGGIIAYSHIDNADRIVESFRAFTGES